jgi:hypothetical protein
MLPLVGGCRHMDGAQVDVLERELRQQEDYIYELEDYLIEYSEKLRQARMAQCQDGEAKPNKSAQSKRPITQGTLDEDLPRTPRLPLDGRDHASPPASSSPALTTPSTAPASEKIDASKSSAPAEAPTAAPPAAAPSPGPEKVSPENMEAPPLEIGPGVSLPWRKSGRLARSPKLPPVSLSAPLLIPDPADYELEADAPAPSAVTKTNDAATRPAVSEELSEPELAEPKQNAPRLAAEKLQIRRILRQAADEPGKPPASLLVVVEALNATDEPADASGEIALMVRPKDAPPSARPIETWTFSAEETKAAWQSSPLGDGLHLELPLNKASLPTGGVELWARLVFPDGRKLLTQVPFDPLELATIEEVNEAARLASAAESAAKQSPPADREQADASLAHSGAVAKSENLKPAAEDKKEAWRASATKLDANRVVGFETPAGGTSDGWSKQPGETRVASTAATSSSKSDKPTWQRSTSARTQGAVPQEWSAER